MNITYKHYTILAIITFSIGILYYAWQEEWLIIHHPWWDQHKQTSSSSFSKKKVTIYAWNAINWHANNWYSNNWIQEQIDTIWSETDEAENAKQLTQATLTLLFEEQLMKKKVYVDSILKTTSDTELIIVLDRNPFSKHMAIREKYMIIESILKTLRENTIKTAKIRFLVNHQALNDAHLDFSQSWPLEGFLTQYST